MTSRRRDIAQSELRVFPSIRCIRHLGCGLWKKRKKKYSCSFNLSINVVAWGQKLHVVYKRFPTYHRQNLLGNLPGISDKSWGLLRHEETIQKTLHVKSAKNQGQQEEPDETMRHCQLDFYSKKTNIYNIHIHHQANHSLTLTREPLSLVSEWFAWQCICMFVFSE